MEKREKPRRDATLCFLLLPDEKRILIAMKKKGFAKGKWNGVGGKVGDEVKESVEEAAIRETKEEILVDVKDMHKVAELDFYFENNPEWDQTVHAFFVTRWEGDPTETDEMDPEWFAYADIPYDQMWVDDILWLPKILEGKKVYGRFSFLDQDTMTEEYLEEVGEF